MRIQKRSLQVPRVSPQPIASALVTTQDEKQIALRSEADLLAVSLETTDSNPQLGALRFLCLATENHPEPILIDMKNLPKLAHKALATLLQGPSIKVAYDWVAIDAWLRTVRLEVKGPFFDLTIAARLLKAGIDKQPASLSVLAARLLQQDPQAFVPSDCWAGHLVHEQLKKARSRAGVLLPLRDKLEKILECHELGQAAKLEFAILPPVFAMTQNGLRIDVPSLQKVQARLQAEAEELREQLRQWFPDTVNLNSARRLKESLAEMGIVVENVQASTLSALEDHREMTTALNRYRQVVRLSNSCIRPILTRVDQKTFRVYPTWNQLGAGTGRFSCSEPNMQGLYGDLEIRSCVIPEEGSVFLFGDFSQIELRVAAYLSGDCRMIEAFGKNEDLHSLTASLLTDTPLDAVTPKGRQAAKAMNFGMLFGMGDEGFRTYAQTKYGITVTLREAGKFRRDFFRAFPQLAEWIEEQAANQSGQSRSLSGRWRRWAEKHPATARELINTPIQGTAADILKKALTLLPDALSAYDAYLVATIHDEIVLEVKKDQAEQVAVVLKEAMERAGKCFLPTVPVVAEVRTSSNWAEK